MNSRLLMTFACLAGVMAGCSREPFSVAPVSGRVTLNGKPVAKVAVMFSPVAPPGNINPGPGSTGITDDEGRYTLKLVGGDRLGAVIGKHKVRITNFNDDTSDTDVQPKAFKPMVPIPAKYNQPDAILDFDVQSSGTTSADFALTSP